MFLIAFSEPQYPSTLCSSSNPQKPPLFLSLREQTILLTLLHCLMYLSVSRQEDTLTLQFSIQELLNKIL